MANYLDDAPYSDESPLRVAPTSAYPGIRTLADKADNYLANSLAIWKRGLSNLWNTGKYPEPTQELQTDQLKWNNLQPEEKRSAIALGTVLYPGTLSRIIASKGINGFLGLLARATGYATEGAGLAAGTQALGNYVTDRPIGEGVGTAAELGALISTPMGVAGDFLIPRLSSQARQVMNRGVVPTVGQAVDEGNMVGKLLSEGEQRATSLLGPLVSGPRARGQQEYLNATLERANPTQNITLSGTTQERIGQLKERLGRNYSRSADLVGDISLNSPEYQQWATNAFRNIHDPNIDMSDELRSTLDDYLRRKINASLSRDASGNLIIPSDSLKKMESDIKQWAFSKSTARNTGYDSEFRAAGNTAENIAQSVNDMRRQISPEAGDIIDMTNPLYSQYKIFQQAASRPGAAKEYGDFTPYQGLVALGKRRMQNPPPPESLQDWFQTGHSVFRSTVPDSGTAGRILPQLMLGGSLLSGAYGQTDYPGADYAKYIAAMMGVGAMGTRTGQATLLNLMNAGERLGPGVRGLAASLGGQNPDTVWSLLGRSR